MRRRWTRFRTKKKFKRWIKKSKKKWQRNKLRKKKEKNDEKILEKNRESISLKKISEKTRSTKVNLGEREMMDFREKIKKTLKNSKRVKKK